MNLLNSIEYSLASGDTYQTSGQVRQDISLAVHLKVKAHKKSYFSIQDVKIVGSNSNNAPLGSAEVKLASNSLNDSVAFNSDWLRALARTLVHLADNVDRLPSPEQTVALMVASKMS
jgi:hypothetical protein